MLAYFTKTLHNAWVHNQLYTMEILWRCVISSADQHKIHLSFFSDYKYRAVSVSSGWYEHCAYLLTGKQHTLSAISFVMSVNITQYFCLLTSSPATQCWCSEVAVKFLYEWQWCTETWFKVSVPSLFVCTNNKDCAYSYLQKHSTLQYKDCAFSYLKKYSTLQYIY